MRLSACLCLCLSLAAAAQLPVNPLENLRAKFPTPGKIATNVMGQMKNAAAGLPDVGTPETIFKNMQNVFKGSQQQQTLDTTNAEKYDYIIVGGGASGCPAAEVLARAGKKVLLLERGGTRDETVNGVSLWRKYVVIERNFGEQNEDLITRQGVRSNVARVLSGGSAINQGIVIRERDDYYEYIASEFGAPYDKEMRDEAYDHVIKEMSPGVVMRPQEQYVQMLKDVGYGDWVADSSKMEVGGIWRPYSTFNASEGVGTPFEEFGGFRHGSDVFVTNKDRTINTFGGKLVLKTKSTARKIEFDYPNGAKGNPRARCIRYTASPELTWMDKNTQVSNNPWDPAVLKVLNTNAVLQQKQTEVWKIIAKLMDLNSALPPELTVLQAAAFLAWDPVMRLTGFEYLAGNQMPAVASVYPQTFYNGLSKMGISSPVAALLPVVDNVAGNVGTVAANTNIGKFVGSLTNVVGSGSTGGGRELEELDDASELQVDDSTNNLRRAQVLSSLVSIPASVASNVATTMMSPFSGGLKAAGITNDDPVPVKLRQKIPPQERLACVGGDDGTEEGEIILAAGALHTPTLMYTSGLGPQEFLQRMGIPLVKDIQGVGENYHDRSLLLLCLFAKREEEQASFIQPDTGYVAAIKGFGEACKSTHTMKDDGVDCQFIGFEENGFGFLSEGASKNTRFFLAPRLRNNPATDAVFTILHLCNPWNGLGANSFCQKLRNLQMFDCFRRLTGLATMPNVPKARGTVRMTQEGQFMADTRFLGHELDMLGAARTMKKTVQMVEALEKNETAAKYFERYGETKQPCITGIYQGLLAIAEWLMEVSGPEPFILQLQELADFLRNAMDPTKPPTIDTETFPEFKDTNLLRYLDPKPKIPPLRDPRIKKIVTFPVMPDPKFSDVQLVQYYSTYMTSMWHSAGTAKMGRVDDPKAVVDPLFRVKGVEKLAIFDASTIPQLTRLNPQIHMMMTGRYAANLRLNNDWTNFQPNAFA